MAFVLLNSNASFYPTPSTSHTADYVLLFEPLASIGFQDITLCSWKPAIPHPAPSHDSDVIMLERSKSQSLDLFSKYSCPVGDLTWAHGFPYHLYTDKIYTYMFNSDFYPGLKAHISNCLPDSSTQTSKKHFISNVYRAEHLIIVSNPLPKLSPFQWTSTPSCLVSRLQDLGVILYPPSPLLSYWRSSLSAHPICLLIQ